MTESAKREQLLREGYCLFEQILDEQLLRQLRATTERVIQAQSEEHLRAHRSQGSLIDVRSDPFMAQLVAHEKALAALAELGYDAPRWASGYIISKPPHSPPLYWHQDWWAWNDPTSYTDFPQQLFLMYYLVDTHRENGCLRVIPGTHRRRHPLHTQGVIHHDADKLAAQELSNPVFQTSPDEVDVPVRAGELVIGDSRIFHAAHANSTNERRTVITLWYYPLFDAMTEPLRAAAMVKWRDHQQRYRWPTEADELIRPLIPRYDGPARPLEADREPGPDLR